MVTIAGFETLALFLKNELYSYYKAIRKEDDIPVLIKTPTSPLRNPIVLQYLRHEYAILENVDLSYALAHIAFESRESTMALILEDNGSEVLESVMPKHGMELFFFLKLAIKLAKAVNEFHRLSMIHLKIRPSNILYHSAKDRTYLIDFSSAISLSSGMFTNSSPEWSKDAIPYISPEQTGRLNRHIDWRSDIYSLGITYYQMLTGTLPFHADHNEEWIYSHIVTRPLAPQTYKPSIPETVSDIVLKCLEKPVEDRYQSTLGLIKDLELCKTRLAENGKVEFFFPGNHDFPEKFQTPQRLYGRKEELKWIVSTFEQVAEIGMKEIVLIKGPAGIGKSSLIADLQKPVIEKRGYLIQCNFNQTSQNVPYGCLIRALRKFTKLLLAEKNDQLALWKQALQSSLGVNGGVLLEVVPEMEKILGVQQSIQELAQAETRVRFNSVLQKFIQTIASVEHPLVLLLDDLQWADPPSLKLIEFLLKDSDIQYFLVIATHEEQKPKKTNFLFEFVSELKKAGITLREQKLQKLPEEQLNLFCSDALHCLPNQTKALTHWIYEKINGNLFFAKQLLNHLFEINLLTFDTKKALWYIHIEQILELNLTESASRLIINKISTLNPQTQTFFKFVACIGNPFDCRILSILYPEESASIVESLKELFKKGLIISELSFNILHFYDSTENQLNHDLHTECDSPFKFLHNQVQKAAYEMLSKEKRQATHLEIGRAIIKNTSPEEQHEFLFFLTNQMNEGLVLITSFEEMVLVAKLNLKAGVKAKKTAAYELSLHYFKVGLELLKSWHLEDTVEEDLPRPLWENHYDLLLGLYNERAESEYLNGGFEDATRFFGISLDHAKTPLEKSEIYSHKTEIFTKTGQITEAVQMGLKGLEILGIKVSKNPSIVSIVYMLVKVLWRFQKKKSKKTIILPESVVKEDNVIFKLIYDLYPAAFLTNQKLFGALILKILTLSLKTGRFQESLSFAYTIFGLLISSGFKRYQTGYRFALMGIETAERRGDTKMLGISFFIYGSLINNWTQPAQMANGYLEKGYKRLVENGSLITAGYSAATQIFNQSLVGLHLDELLSNTTQKLRFFKKIKDKDTESILIITRQFSLALQGKTEEKISFTDKNTVENDLLNTIQAFDQSITYVWYAIKKTQLCFLYKQYDKALEFAESAQELLDGNMGLAFLPDHYFVYFLVLSSQVITNRSKQNRKHFKLMFRLQRKMKSWSRLCPENFLHKSLLMKAELLRIKGKQFQAKALYLEAIQTAHQHGYIHNAGIACERLAEFLIETGSNILARFFLEKAQSAFREWGATAKSDHLRQRLENFDNEQRKSGLDSVASTVSQDLSTILKVTQTIGSEFVLEKLLKNLMQLMIENTGANKGFLILKKGNQWMINAEGTIGEEKKISLKSFSLTLADSSKSPLPLSVFRYVERTQQRLLMVNASSENTFIKDPYILNRKPKSLLCSPIIHQAKLIGILYLENDQIEGIFTPSRLEILGLLTAQAAISIENAWLYADQRTVNEKLHREINERREIESELLSINQELERSNQERLETQSQLIQSAKLASIGELATGMAHELNQPLMYIRNSVQLSLMDGVDNLGQEMVTEVMQDIEKSTGSMMNIINHLRDFARHQELTLIPLDVHDLLDDSLILVNEQLRIRSITLEKQYEEDLPFILGNAQQLEQVFINILTNARDAMEDQLDAKLIINTGFLQLSENLGEVTIAFIDNGTGISEQDQEKIFDPFFTTKDAGKGTGFGLSISYGIIRDHEGRILVENNRLGGVTFRVIMPIDLREVEPEKHQLDAWQ